MDEARRATERSVELRRVAQRIVETLPTTVEEARAWQPTSKRLADRVAALGEKPERMAERIEQALTEQDPRRALLVMTALQLETLALAPDGPNVDRAREWLSEGHEVVRAWRPCPTDA